MVPNGLAMTSPAPRQTSAQAMTQDFRPGHADDTRVIAHLDCRSATWARYSSSSTKT